MHKAKFIISLILAAIILFVQVGGVFAAPALPNSTPVIGIVQSITLETDSTTGVTIIIVDLMGDNQIVQRVRVSQEKAIVLGLVVLNGDGKPGINNLALGKLVEIDPTHVIPTQEENQHPMGNALATFFSDIAGVDYEFIMTLREQGVGFGTIAQTLWLTAKLEGDSQVFEALLRAKQTGDYSTFILTDGSTPENWGQLKKAILNNGKKNGVSVVMPNSNDNGSNQGSNGNGSGNGNQNGNNGDKDKDKDKDKNKDKDTQKDKDKDKKK